MILKLVRVGAVVCTASGRRTFTRSTRRLDAKYTTSLNIFDRETKRQQKNWTCSHPNYKQFEYVKEEVGYRMADRVFDIKRSLDTVLDLGCQRGYVSKHLTNDTVKKLYMFESAEQMLAQAEMPEQGVEVEKRVFDEENDLPFADNSLDLVVSSLK